MNELAIKHCEEIIEGTASSFSRVFHKFSTKKPDLTGADILGTERGYKAAPVIKYPLWNITINRIPISAVVQYTDGIWLAEVESLNVIGDGCSIEEAISDLEEQISHFMDFYKQQDSDHLTEYAKILKAKYSTLDHN